MGQLTFPPVSVGDMIPLLSHEALALFRQHIERHGDIEVDDSNRETYRELARAGMIRPVAVLARSIRAFVIRVVRDLIWAAPASSDL
jgi:hypothetical protein